jgi:glycine/D-amino acid oxidase-like deaminating enzyme
MNVELVGADEIARRVPGLRMDDVAGGSFCGTDGFIAPLKVLGGFMSRSVQRGVRVWTETAVTGIEVAGAHVETTRGRRKWRVWRAWRFRSCRCAVSW